MHTNHRRQEPRSRRLRRGWLRKGEIKHAAFKGYRVSHRRILDAIRTGAMDEEDALFPKRPRDVSNTRNHR